MEEFSIIMKDDKLKKNTLITKGFMQVKSFWDKLMNVLGCNPIYQAVVVSEPEQTEEGYKYNIKVISKTIRIFLIKIKTIKL